MPRHRSSADIVQEVDLFHCRNKRSRVMHLQDIILTMDKEFPYPWLVPEPDALMQEFMLGCNEGGEENNTWLENSVQEVDNPCLDPVDALPEHQLEGPNLFPLDGTEPADYSCNASQPPLKDPDASLARPPLDVEVEDIMSIGPAQGEESFKNLT